MNRQEDESRPLNRNGRESEVKRTNWRLIISLATVVIVFLVGFVPTYVVARRRGQERDAAQAALRVSNLQNALGNAVVDARGGDYERARQGTSNFFTNLRTEVDRGNDSIFSKSQQLKLGSVLEERDDTITSLARSDPYSVDRLTKLYNEYREAVAVTARE